jgi:hypothetical protein
MIILSSIFLAGCKQKRLPESDEAVASSGPISVLDYTLVETLCLNEPDQEKSLDSDRFVSNLNLLEFKSCEVPDAILVLDEEPSFQLSRVTGIVNA